MPEWRDLSTALEMTEMPEQAEDEAIELGMTGEGKEVPGRVRDDGAVKEIPGQFIAHGLKS